MEELPQFPAEVFSADEVALESLMEQFGDNQTAVLKFYRVEKGQADALIEEMTPSEFDFAALGRRHGHGTYRVKVYVKDPMHGRFVLKANPTMRYAGAVDQQAAAGPLTQRNDGLGELAQAMVTGFQELGKLIVQSSQANHVNPEDVRRGVLQDMAAMKELFGNNGGGGQAGSFAEMFSILQQGIDMGKSINPENPPEGMTAFMKAIEPLTPALGSIVERALSPKPAAPRLPMRPNPVTPGLPGFTQPVETPAGPETASQPAAPAAAQPMEETEMFGFNRYTAFSQQIGMLVEVAKNNPETDPYAYAVLLLDAVPPQYVDMLLKDEKLVDNLAAVNPEVNHPGIRTFFEAVVSEVRELTKPEPEADNPPHVPTE